MGAHLIPLVRDIWQWAAQHDRTRPWYGGGSADGKVQAPQQQIRRKRRSVVCGFDDCAGAGQILPSQTPYNSHHPWGDHLLTSSTSSWPEPKSSKRKRGKTEFVQWSIMFQAWGAKIQSAKITESRPASQIPNKYILGAELAPIRLDIVAQLQG